MPAHQFRLLLAVLIAAAIFSPSSHAQNVRYETGADGVEYRVTTQTVQVPVTEMRKHEQTFYRQKFTTEMVQSQQMYAVPTMQYRLVSRIRGRWNPFVTPYVTYHYEPITTWQHRVATVSTPVSRLSWAPETQTIEAPVTVYKSAEQTVKVAMSQPRSLDDARPLTASAAPSATIAARPSTSADVASAAPIGGQRLTSDPPRQATGWRPSADRTYR